MKQFENGQQVIVNYDGKDVRFTYIGRMPVGWGQRPHAVQNDNDGLKAVADDEIRAAPVGMSGWINVYPNSKTSSIAYSTKEKAIECAADDRITTLLIEWDE